MSKADRMAKGFVAGVIFAIGGALGILAHPIYILVFAVPAWLMATSAARGY